MTTKVKVRHSLEVAVLTSCSSSVPLKDGHAALAPATTHCAGGRKSTWQEHAAPAAARANGTDSTAAAEAAHMSRAEQRCNIKTLLCQELEAQLKLQLRTQVCARMHTLTLQSRTHSSILG